MWTSRALIGSRWMTAMLALGAVAAVAAGPPARAVAATPPPAGAVAATPPPAPPHVFSPPGSRGDDEAAAATAAASVGDHSHCLAAAKDPVPDGKPIVVSLPPAPAFTVGKINPSWWRKPPVSSPSWQLNFLGLTWLPPLAHRAADDGQLKSLAALVDQAVTFHRQNPDPGDNRYGWDEGTAMRRLQTLN